LAEKIAQAIELMTLRPLIKMKSSGSESRIISLKTLKIFPVENREYISLLRKTRVPYSSADE
jgi:hypothetical protein